VIRRLVEVFDVDLIEKVDLDEFVSIVAGLFLPPSDSISVEIHKEVPHGYYGEELPPELLPVKSIRQISTDTRLTIGMTVASQRFSNIKVVGIGRIQITSKKVESLGVWIIEVQEVDPPENEVKRSTLFEKFLNEFFVKTVVTLFFELLKKIGVFTA